MRLLTLEDLELGMRVKLLFQDQGYDLDERNPAIGTQWECAGTVVEIYNYEAEVEWDNGSMNIYVDNDLTPADSSNFAEGRPISIW